MFFVKNLKYLESVAWMMEKDEEQQQEEHMEELEMSLVGGLMRSPSSPLAAQLVDEGRESIGSPQRADSAQQQMHSSPGTRLRRKGMEAASAGNSRGEGNGQIAGGRSPRKRGNTSDRHGKENESQIIHKGNSNILASSSSCCLLPHFFDL